MKKNAFTLAETLITLVIIGVVAALTIPVLIKNHEKKETLTNLTKVYSAFQNALKLSELDNGNYQAWEISSGDWDAGNVEFEKYFKPYLKLTKYCGKHITYASSECMINVPQGKYGGLIEDFWGWGTYFVLADGTTARFSRSGNIDIFTINFDINGAKKPNRFGKDTFTLSLPVNQSNGFQPPAYQNDRNNNIAMCTNHTVTSWSDQGCLALIIKDSWQITDDYDW